jgi:hypothetical protein
MDNEPKPLITLVEIEENLVAAQREQETVLAEFTYRLKRGIDEDEGTDPEEPFGGDRHPRTPHPSLGSSAIELALEEGS